MSVKTLWADDVARYGRRPVCSALKVTVASLNCHLPGRVFAS